MDDRVLAEAARRGDIDAYAELVRRHQPAILRLCASMLSDPVEGEEAAQDAFVKAFESIEGFRSDSAFSTWIYRIASRECLDRLRRRSRRAASLDALVEGEGRALEALFASEPGPEPAAEAKDLVARLLAALPEEQRLALVLRETEGLSYEEIAETTGWSLDSVKARLRRARETLEETLRHFSGPGPV